MRNIKFISLAFAVAATFLSSCSNEEVQSNQQAESKLRHNISLKVGSVEDETKDTRAIFATNLKSNTPIYWQKNDTVGVLASESESLYPLTLESRSANMLTATFSGEIEGDLGAYAVYPYNKKHKISGTTLTYHLPSTYTYTGWDTDFATNSDGVDNQKISASPALLAKISTSDNESTAKFTHLGGILCIKIDKMPTSAGYLSVTADRQICGDFKVDLSSSQPKLESDEDLQDVPDSLKTVTINVSGTYNTSAVFYIPLPEGYDYKFSVELAYTSPGKGKMGSGTSTKTMDIERGKIYIASLTQSTMHQGGYKIIQGHKFVDLGLSKYWADTNVGATVAADNGNQYAWAETSTKGSYDLDNYSDFHWFRQEKGWWYCEKYQDEQETLVDDEDAAYKVWGNFCKMPTKSEMEELINGTTQKEASRKDSNGKTISGIEFTSKKNSSSIFMPYNNYWSSTSGDTSETLSEIFGITMRSTYQQAYGLKVAQSGCLVGETYRCDGLYVRPVLK